MLVIAAGLPLMKTLGEPIMMAPVGGPIEAAPMYSPASAPPARPPAIMAPAATAARPPVATTATANAAPSAAPISRPIMALLWATWSPILAAGRPMSGLRRERRGVDLHGAQRRLEERAMRLVLRTLTGGRVGQHGAVLHRQPDDPLRQA